MCALGILKREKLLGKGKERRGFTKKVGLALSLQRWIEFRKVARKREDILNKRTRVGTSTEERMQGVFKYRCIEAILVGVEG